MTDRRRITRKKITPEMDEKPTKEEDNIARMLRFNCPTKSTMFDGNEVYYFLGSKAVDVLIESKKYGYNAKNAKFASRASAVNFLRVLFDKGLFFRARKLVAKRKEKNEGGSKSPKKGMKEHDNEAYVINKEKLKSEVSDDDDDEEINKKKEKKDDDDKKQRKVKLELHQSQQFNDSNDVYVWVFDPTPLYKQVIGALIVLGTIAGCLFPLWPDWLKNGVYYSSLVGLAGFGLLLGVAFVRSIFFVVIWLATMGRHKLWILPNLTEDCGFFESFQPWYTYEYCAKGIKKKKRSDKKKAKSSEIKEPVEGGEKERKEFEGRSESDGISCFNRHDIESDKKSSGDNSTAESDIQVLDDSSDSTNTRKRIGKTVDDFYLIDR